MSQPSWVHTLGAGVGAGGLIELRAQLYRTQEQARLVRDGEAERQPRRKGPLELGGSTGSGRNAGVGERNQRDMAQIQVQSSEPRTRVNANKC